eukprot:Anaeramoba_ignava/a607441_325.p1 GENE.a607441_325~~a607441_325.p1  ORF type:complete len:578 (+),score=158.17 a607441_325:38-1735(+)
MKDNLEIADYQKQEREEKQRAANYVLISNKAVIPIKPNDIKKLIKSPFLMPPLATRKPPETENLIIDQLPTELFYMILEFLSPGELIKFSLTCKSIYELSFEHELWVRVCSNYQRYFTWNHVGKEAFRRYGGFVSHSGIYGYQDDIKEKIVYLQEIRDLKDQKFDEEHDTNENDEDLNLENNNNNNDNTQQLRKRKGGDEQRKKEKAQRIKKLEEEIKIKEKKYKEFSENKKQYKGSSYDKTTIINEHSNRVPTHISIKQDRITYVHLLENPRQEFENRIKLLISNMRELKKEKENDQIQVRFEQKFSSRRIFYETFGEYLFMLVPTFLLLFLLFINIRVESGKLSGFFIFSPVIIPLGMFVYILFNLSRYTSYDKLPMRILSGVLAIVFVMFWLFALKVDGRVKILWMFILSPVYISIFVGFIVILILVSHSRYPPPPGERFFGSLIFSGLFLFTILLGLRADRIITWNFFLVFSPLFAFGFVSFFWICLTAHRVDFFICLFGFLEIVISILVSFLILFLNGTIKHITWPLVPYYIAGAIFWWISAWQISHVYRRLKDAYRNLD